MQWAWFGGAFNLGDYYSCIDYEIVGGDSADQEVTQFDGGDFSNPTKTGPNGQCKFFNTRKLRTCLNEPCWSGELPGQNNGRPAIFDAIVTATPTTPTPSAIATPVTPTPSTPTPSATATPATPTPATPTPSTPTPSATAPATCQPVVVTVTATVTATVTVTATAAPTVSATPDAGRQGSPSASASATATATATATASPSASATAAPTQSDLTPTYSIASKWSNVMTVDVRVVANKDVTGGWSFAVQMHSSMVVSSVWNGLVASNVVNGNSRTVTIKNPSWQPALRKGAVVNIGMNVGFPAGNAPVATAEGYSFAGSQGLEQAESQETAVSAGASANPETQTGSNIAAIVGTSVGAVCAAGLLAAGVALFVRRQRQQRQQPPKSEEIQFAHQ
jgi:hypothetical protein